MAAVRDLEPETPGELLADARALRAVADRAEAELLTSAAKYAAMHASGDVVSEAEWLEDSIPIAGPGAPQIEEFCVAEFAAALGMSTDAGRRYLGQAVELAHRLPPLARLVDTGDLPAWRARRIADATLSLSAPAASFVAATVAPVAHKVGPVTLDRLVEEARARFDPEEAEQRAADAAEARHATVHLSGAGVDGVVDVTASVDLPDAVDLEDVLRAGAARLAADGSSEPLDVRRAKALGMLARGELDLTGDGPGQSAARARPISLTLHLSADPTSPLVRVQETGGFAMIDQLAAWCLEPARQLDVQPVIDLSEHVHVEGYEVPDRMKQRARLRDVRCVFPHCHLRARRCDCDHVVSAAQGGATCTCNIAPLCRGHHRLKTQTSWTYAVLEPGSYLWTSPYGYRFLRNHEGTVDVSPKRRPGSNGCLYVVPTDSDPPDDS
jgi:hypothetical protein